MHASLSTNCTLCKIRICPVIRRCIWYRLSYPSAIDNRTCWRRKYFSFVELHPISTRSQRLELSRGPRRSRSTGAPGRKRLLLPRPSRTPRLVPGESDVIAIIASPTRSRLERMLSGAVALEEGQPPPPPITIPLTRSARAISAAGVVQWDTFYSHMLCMIGKYRFSASDMYPHACAPHHQ